ncbi:MAG: CRISPR-associated protein Csx18 [Aulosira sp. ZfuVER01]|nr:CRISPR-associated protein Csx18 [Aulosira sp. ZfuVER01]MDZ8001700.1 CRISPR-associated protein Csx18 [Aulosira sp. DedVER01a]MDZ8055198.1 CRISPR-associated protein Csx18 [Aulosira sp. ZfuCHP01]
MYISPRASRVRNILVSVSTGSITFVILLIAPLGLAAVIVNTLLVTFATYIVSNVADRVIAWLEPAADADLISDSSSQKQNLARQQRQSTFQRWR